METQTLAVEDFVWLFHLTSVFQRNCLSTLVLPRDTGCMIGMKVLEPAVLCSCPFSDYVIVTHKINRDAVSSLYCVCVSVCFFEETFGHSSMAEVVPITVTLS